MSSNIKQIGDISWDEVFKLWESQEAHLPHWIEHYTSRGFTTWKEWRTHTIQDLHLDVQRWSLYEVLDPVNTVPTFCAGPFRAWKKKYYGDECTPTFSTLAKHTDIQQNETINQIISSFPNNTTLVGLHNNDNIVIIEGLHRALALALAQQRGDTLRPNIQIALTDFGLDIPLLGHEDSPT